MARTTFNGKTVDQRTADQLAEVEKLFGRRLVLSQGSWSTAVSQSAGTHAGGGVFDVSVSQYGKPVQDELVVAMRTVGIAFWIRQADEGDWPIHGHGCSIGCPSLSDAAEDQVADYLAGLNGLRTHKRDPHAALGVRPTTWEKYQAKASKTLPWLVLNLGAKANKVGRYVGPVGLAMRMAGVSSNKAGAKRIQRHLGHAETGYLTRDQIAWLADELGLNTK